VQSEVVDLGRPLNAVPLRNAVLCAECDVVSDSPGDQCRVCGSTSLFNISRLLGGMPKHRARLVVVPPRTERSILPFPRVRPPRTRHGRTPEPKTAELQLHL
jgi:hypothetical protein